MNTRHFLFTKSERRALLLLCFIAIIAQVYAIYFKPFKDESSGKSEKLILTKFIEKETSNLDSPIPTESSKRNKKKSKSTSHKQRKKENFKPFNFDPNAIDSLQWLSLGLKPKIIKNILNYKKKGGHFYKAEDLKKIYNINKDQLDLILPYCKVKRTKSYLKSDHKEKLNYQGVHSDSTRNSFTERSAQKESDPIDFNKNIPNATKANQTKNKFYASTYERKVIDINNADSIDFKTLKGIGSVLSKRIVKYRKNIGGFHSINQLLEVYGLNEEVLLANEEYLDVSGNLETIDINSIDLKTLYKHYYFDYKTAKAIVNYRHQHGLFTNISDLKNIKIIADSTLTKIEPYLIFKSGAKENEFNQLKN